MTIRMSARVRNAMMNAYEAAIGASPKLLIYTGAPPTNLTDAASGTLLVTINLPADWMTAASNGVVSRNGTWTGVATQAGIAGYYRIVASDNGVDEQGTVAMSGGDATINNTSIAVNQSVTVTTFNKTASNA